MSKTQLLPSLQEIQQLPSAWNDSVQEHWIDENGHMNIRYYIDLGGYSTDKVCRDVGIDNSYRNDRRLGVFTAEQHVRYFKEMHLGTPITTHVRMVDLNDKAAHMLSLIVNAETNELACIYETLLVHVNMDTRRAQSFPADVASGFKQLLEQHQQLSWDAPISGALGVRG